MEQAKMIQITEENISSIKEWVKSLNGRLQIDVDYFHHYTIYTNTPGVNDEIGVDANENDWLIDYRGTIVVCPNSAIKALREIQFLA